MFWAVRAIVVRGARRWSPKHFMMRWHVLRIVDSRSESLKAFGSQPEFGREVRRRTVNEGFALLAAQEKVFFLQRS